MHFLAKYYNMTEYHFKLHGVRGGRTYLLEINPHFVNRTTDDWMNVIDARWIDTSSGLFVDITSVRKDFEARKKGHLGALMCKDRHRYLVRDISANPIFPQFRPAIMVESLYRNKTFFPCETATSKTCQPKSHMITQNCSRTSMDLPP